MIRLEDLALFVRTAALGSFSATARESGLTPGQVSAAIARLERELDLRLFARTTRSLRLSGEGERYLPYAQSMMATLREGREALHGAEAALQGRLQIAAPSDLGRHALLGWLAEFRRLHPHVDWRLHLSDQVADLFRDPVDVAIRLGRLDDADYVALPLASDNRRVLVASPGYLARRGMPASLEALREHDCLLYQLGPRAHDRWAFQVDGRRQVVTVQGTLVCDDAEVVRRWAVAGEGITYKSWLDVCDDVEQGRLALLFPEAGEALPLQLACPHRRQFSPVVRALHAFLAERCSARAARLQPHLPSP